jgi:hypothetical protein
MQANQGPRRACMTNERRAVANAGQHSPNQPAPTPSRSRPKAQMPHMTVETLCWHTQQSLNKNQDVSYCHSLDMYIPTLPTASCLSETHTGTRAIAHKMCTNPSLHITAGPDSQNTAVLVHATAVPLAMPARPLHWVGAQTDRSLHT